MSKRFGRNQKRKLKKEIEELKNTIELGQMTWNGAMKQIDVLTLRVQRLDRSIKDIASILGNNFVGLNAKGVAIDSKFLPKTFQAIVPERFDRILNGMMSEDIANDVIQLIDLPVITGDVYRGIVSDMHFVLESTLGTVGYAIDRGALSRMPIDALVEKVSMLLAQQLKKLVS